MQKRALLIKTIELVFAAVLFLAFIGILVKLILPTIAGEANPALDDFTRYTAEMRSLTRGDIIPVVTLNANYTLGFYAPSSEKPPQCQQSACMCLYPTLERAQQRTPLECQRLEKIADACSADVGCFTHSPLIVTKNRAQPPETLYFCQKTDGRITVTKTESEC